MILKYKSNISVLCLISIIFLLCSCAALSNNASQTKKMEKKPVVVMLSGFDGPMNYAVFSSRLTDLGYHVLLLDSRLLPRSDPAACRLALEREIKGALKSANAVSSKAVVIGYSLGGGIALSVASGMPESVSQVIAYYPATNIIKNRSFHTLLDGFQVPILVFQGEKDSFEDCCSAVRIWAIATVAKARKKAFELVVYPNAGHCFNIEGSSRFAYYDKDAEDSWKQTLKTLKKYPPK